VTGCRIGKVKMKSGGAAITVLPPPTDLRRTQWSRWDYTIIITGPPDMSNADVSYILELAKLDLVGVVYD
jgi:hypothetical protein